MSRYLVALMIPLVLAACGAEEHTDIKQWMKDASKDIRGRVPPLPEIKPFPVVSYDAGDLLDPFRPSKIEGEKKAGGGSIKVDLERRKEELEKYPLESLRFVGLLRNDKMLYATVAADRKLFRVKIGNYMGQNNGMITAIQTSPELDDGKLVLREQVQDAGGNWVERETMLEMRVQEDRK